MSCSVQQARTLSITNYVDNVDGDFDNEKMLFGWKILIWLNICNKSTLMYCRVCIEVMSTYEE